MAGDSIIEAIHAGIGGDHDKPHFRDALGLIELLRQRVQEASKEDSNGHGGHGRFCTVFNCMDGRCQRLVHAWCECELCVDYADTITIAGCDSVMLTDQAEAERAFKMAQISIDKHGSRDAVVVGHSSCAGNPVSNAEHYEDVKQAVALIAQRGLFRSVVGLFVDVEERRVELVCRAAALPELQKAVA